MLRPSQILTEHSNSNPARPHRRDVQLLLLALLGLVSLSGCTGPREYIANHFKVGPNYQKPPAPVAKEWTDAADKRVRSDADDLAKWWTVFNDPRLDSLICFAYQQNLTLREAGYRVLAARAQWAIAVGQLFPQSQTARGDFFRSVTSQESNRG